jgi:hypothetical protein
MSYADRFPPSERYQVVFSRVEGVRGWVVEHWRAELHDHGDCSGWYSHPLAIAWITDYSPVLGPMLAYIIVCDHHRGGDLAPRLVAECQRRWPDIELTPRLTPSGGFRGEGPDS